MGPYLSRYSTKAGMTKRDHRIVAEAILEERVLGAWRYMSGCGSIERMMADEIIDMSLKGGVYRGKRFSARLVSLEEVSECTPFRKFFEKVLFLSTLWACLSLQNLRKGIEGPYDLAA